jgi:hypothetical protein
MRRVMVLLGALSAIALSAHANIIDFDNDPGAGYQFYFNAGAGRRALDDVNRVSALPIKEIRIVFFNLNNFAVNATLYVYAATGGAGTGVDNNALLYTATINNIPNGLFLLSFGTPNIAAGFQNLWIGLSAANAANAGMVLSPNPYPAPGTSADVFAWDDDGNGAIDNDDYWNFGPPPNPVANFAIEVYAIPEPASMIALGSGLVGLLALRRRRQRV